MSAIVYPTGSAWKATPQTSFYLDNLVLRDIANDPTDQAITVGTQYDMKPFNLAYDLYGSKDYWWVFQIMNMDIIRDPIYDFRAGISIRAPTKDRLLSSIRTVI